MKKHKKRNGNKQEILERVTMSEELQEKVMLLRVCNPCPVMKKISGGKRHTVIFYKRKRCQLCGTMTKKWKPPVELEAEAKAFAKSRDKGERDEAMQKIIDLIERRAADFDCPGTISKVTKGPIVTEYALVPDRFVRVRKLRTLDEDLALSLQVDHVSIRPIPGERALGIQVPNEVREAVTFANSLPNVIAHKDDMELPLNFGIMSDGSPYVEDLARYPHLLIGGATGSGKSVLLSQLICSMMAVRSPKQVQFLMIDPKTVELFPYASIPHMLREPVANVWRVIEVMEDLIKTMRSRTEHLHDYKVRTIKELNDMFKKEAETLVKEADEAKKKGNVELAKGRLERAEQQLNMCWPYIVMIIDEMAEIVLENKRDFITRMASLSAMARATGISVIAATQRPSVDVLPGKVKVNFLARAALKVPSPQDSKTILNFKGAETLLNRGDMFMLSPDQTGLQRIHVANCQKADRDQMIKRAIHFKDYVDGVLPDFPAEK